jgi:transposase-like protein
MEQTDVEIGDPSKQDSRGRRVVNREEREQLLEEYERSGLTQKAFARQAGVKYATFVGWIRRRRKERQDQRRGSAVKFESVGTLEAFLPVVEVQLPDGIIVRGQQAREVARLVEQLRSPHGC